MAGGAIILHKCPSIYRFALQLLVSRLSVDVDFRRGLDSHLWLRGYTSK